MTFGAPYRLTVGNVADVAGNPLLAPANFIDVDAFIPNFPEGRKFRLIEFLPLINREEDVTQQLHLFIAVIQEVVNLLLCEVDEWAHILDPDLAPEEFLDAMLADLGDPFGRFLLSEIDKRRLIRALVDFYKQKGTGVGMVNAIRFFLGIEAVIDIFGNEGWELAFDPNRLFPLPTSGGSDSVIVDDSPPNINVAITESVTLQETLTVELNGVVVSATATSVGDELSASDTDLGTPPAQLGPNQFGLYSFCILVPVDLTLQQAEDIIFLANYFKPAHTHLVCIIQPNPPTFDTSGLDVLVVGQDGIPQDHLVLGFSELGGGAGQPGTWILH
jgi:phage tail-like protein